MNVKKKFELILLEVLLVSAWLGQYIARIGSGPSVETKICQGAEHCDKEHLGICLFVMMLHIC